MPSYLPPSADRPAPVPSRPELPEGVWRPEPLPPPSGRDALPRWPLWAPFAGLLGALLVAVVGVGVITLVIELAGVDTADDTPPAVAIGGTYVQDLGLIGTALLLARVLDAPLTPAKFGLRLTRLRPAIGWTLLSWFIFFAFATVWGIALDITENDDLPEEFGVDGSTVALIAVAILVCVLAPIAEELFFRGFCFTALRRALGMLPAAILTGIIFGAIHLGSSEIEFIVPLMVFGFSLCLLYVWTDSLLPCIVLHALNNGLAFGVMQGWGAATVPAMAAAAVLSALIVLPFARRASGPAVAA
ncbi:MAG TPA: CPBP family intramembrane glutamic endopeptidase [Solirubrobacteraceae bacterium]|nr:CPBP family intramembrane glutamic endopeptidase [Solirubrobacteraceae bacterium]